MHFMNNKYKRRNYCDKCNAAFVVIDDICSSFSANASSNEFRIFFVSYDSFITLPKWKSITSFMHEPLVIKQYINGYNMTGDIPLFKSSYRIGFELKNTNM